MSTPETLLLSIGSKLTGESCRCQSCGLVFRSESGFNDHRTGDFQPALTRRCRTTEEIFARGWRLGAGNKIGKPFQDKDKAWIEKARGPGSGFSDPSSTSAIPKHTPSPADAGNPDS